MACAIVMRRGTFIANSHQQVSLQDVPAGAVRPISLQFHTAGVFLVVNVSFGAVLHP
jgi:hypothetical protein